MGKEKLLLIKKFIFKHQKLVKDYHSCYHKRYKEKDWKEQLRILFVNALSAGGLGNIAAKAKSIEKFEKKINKMKKPTYDELQKAFNVKSYQDLFEALQELEQMGPKKSALFLRDILYFKNLITEVSECSISKLKEEMLVPVDIVITRMVNSIFDKNYKSGKKSFKEINNLAKKIFPHEPILLEDLWFWGRFYRCKEEKKKKDLPYCEFNESLLIVNTDVTKEYREELLDFGKRKTNCPFKEICSKMPTLTKSKYMNGLQCLRLLWFANKKQLPEITLSDKHKFVQGHEFEEYVKPLFPKGVDLDGMEFNENITKTQELIKKKSIIFEAGVMVDNLFVRSDILEYKNGWNLYEIKSTTKVKDQHYPDLAFQKYVLEKSGLKIEKCYLIHLNNEYVKNGKIDSKELCAIEDVTSSVNAVIGIEENIKEFLHVISLKEPPEAHICKDCNKPYICALKEDCWGKLPKYHVMQLTNWRQYWNMFKEGIKDIKDIPTGTKLCIKDQVIHEAVIKNKVILSKEHIKHFLSSLNYPLYHFDFETFDTAVPLFDKSKPYQKIPFQYSLHIESKNGSVKHYEFLADGNGDPRPALLSALKKAIGSVGDVIVYNKSFEISVLTKLAEDFPSEKMWIQNVLDRIVDLASMFRAFYYYNPAQKGSYSLKKVLPAITGKDYSKLEINNGGDASMLYFYSHIKDEIKGKDKIRENLLTYCELDTQAMVDIIREIGELIN